LGIEEKKECREIQNIEVFGFSKLFWDFLAEKSVANRLIKV
jgi:hypothetical protein